MQAQARQKELNFPPGDLLEYSNGGYLVLAELIERVTGERYADFLKEAIFDPLGMHDTLVLDDRRKDLPARLALGYAKDGKGWRDVSYFPAMYVYGYQGVISTINDLYKWDQALYTDRLVSRSTLALAFTPARTNDGRELTDDGMSKIMHRQISYGFGWDISSLDEQKVV